MVDEIVLPKLTKGDVLEMQLCFSRGYSLRMIALLWGIHWSFVAQLRNFCGWTVDLD